ncbi:MAG: NrfD/PsrC family molybdoenzyme membrane anchor subunit [Chloroflexota bacterium]
MDKRSLIKDFLWIIVFVGAVAIILRFARGLGYTTGLNDVAPWGLWIAFKLAFVALAGGGFTLAAMVYIFQLETYRPIVRPAIMIALLGYGSFIVSLLFDLGLPWRIYMPIIHWQHHSVMFEIAWCVMLYFTVLNLEFGPVILEHRWFHHAAFRWISRALHRLTIPIVIAGIVLSTLHQSSLGSLFLIMPFRVHPLWYSPLIPVFFFISAIGLGLMALILDEFVVDWIIGRKPHKTLLPRLAKIASVVLWVYLALRLGDLAVRGVIPAALDGSWQSLLFGAEILLGGALPATLLLVPKVRDSNEGLISCAILTVFGIVSQRFSLSLLTMQLPQGASYIPSMLEIAIALTVPAAASLLYFLFAENLGVVQEKIPPPPSPYARPQFNQHTLIHLPNSFSRKLRWRSALAVPVIALTIAVLPPSLVTGLGQPHTPVEAARGGGDILSINGERDGSGVALPHQIHLVQLQEFAAATNDISACLVCHFQAHPEWAESIAAGETDCFECHYAHEAQAAAATPADEAVCLTCHHLNLPNDEATPCWRCHQDMSSSTSIFDHLMHQRKLGDNASCAECHVGERLAVTTEPCRKCHETMMSRAERELAAFETKDVDDFNDKFEYAAEGKRLAAEAEKSSFSHLAPGYITAMHDQCVPCHQHLAETADEPDLGQCAACHKLDEKPEIAQTR